MESVWKATWTYKDQSVVVTLIESHEDRLIQMATCLAPDNEFFSSKHYIFIGRTVEEIGNDKRCTSLWLEEIADPYYTLPFAKEWVDSLEHEKARTSPGVEEEEKDYLALCDDCHNSVIDEDDKGEILDGYMGTIWEEGDGE